MSHAIGATALSTYAIEAGHEYGLHDVAGSPVSVPYQPGLNVGSRTLKGRDYRFFLTILGRESNGTYTRARYLTNLQALAALFLNPDGSGEPQPFVLTRTLTLSAGVQVCTINAIYRDGFQVTQVAAHGGRVSPVLTLLDPYWLNGATKVYA